MRFKEWWQRYQLRKKEKKLMKLKAKRAYTKGKYERITETINATHKISLSQEDTLANLKGEYGELDVLIDNLEKEVNENIARKIGVKI